MPVNLFNQQNQAAVLQQAMAISKPAGPSGRRGDADLDNANNNLAMQGGLSGAVAAMGFHARPAPTTPAITNQQPLPSWLQANRPSNAPHTTYGTHNVAVAVIDHRRHMSAPTYALQCTLAPSPFFNCSPAHGVFQHRTPGCTPPPRRCRLPIAYL